MNRQTRRHPVNHYLPTLNPYYDKTVSNKERNPKANSRAAMSFSKNMRYRKKA